MSLTKIFALPIPTRDVIIEHAKKTGSKKEHRCELLFDGKKDLAIRSGISGLGLRFRYGNEEMCTDEIDYIFCGYPSKPERLPSPEQVEELARILGVENRYGLYEVESY